MRATRRRAHRRRRYRLRQQDPALRLNGISSSRSGARTQQAFANDARGFLAWLRSSRPAPEHDRVRIAGEPEREYRARRSREGIPVDDETWNEIRAAAAKLKLSPDKVDALARGR
jgi:hypothetical protein